MFRGFRSFRRTIESAVQSRSLAFPDIIQKQLMVSHDSQLMPVNEIHLAHDSPALNRNFNDNSLVKLPFDGVKRKHRYAQDPR